MAGDLGGQGSLAQGQAGEEGRSQVKQGLACPVNRVWTPSWGSGELFENGNNLKKYATISKVTCHRDHSGVLEQGGQNKVGQAAAIV